MESVSVQSLVNHLSKDSEHRNLKLIKSNGFFSKEIQKADFVQAGLCLTGFTKNFNSSAIQIISSNEEEYIEQVIDRNENEQFEHFFSYAMEIPCVIIITENINRLNRFVSLCIENDIPVIAVTSRLPKFLARLSNALDELFAPSITLHGVLVEVFGIGILIEGSSGIGKSECALELLERGHRLVADDLVKLNRVQPNIIEGKGNAKFSSFMEIRGLGIINIHHLFGVGSVRDKVELQLIIVLEDWKNSSTSNRLEFEEKKIEILGLSFPKKVIPVRSGRNIPILIETAAKDYRLQNMGYFSFQDFDQRLKDSIEQKNTEEKRFRGVQDGDEEICN